MSFVGSTPVARYVYETAAANGKRVQALGGAKNHMVVLPDADLDARGRRGGERGLRVRGRALHGDLGGRRGRWRSPTPLVEAIAARTRDVHDRSPATSPGCRDGPARDRRRTAIACAATSTAASTDGARARRRRPRPRPCPTTASSSVPACSTGSPRRWRSTATRSSGRSSRSCGSTTYDDAVRLVSENPYGNGVAIFTRDGGAARRFEHEVDAGMVGVNVPIPVPMAYYSFGGWKQSLFGDTHVHGPEGVHFYTRGKVVTSRWADPGEPWPRPRLPDLKISRPWRGRAASRDIGTNPGCRAWPLSRDRFGVARTCGSRRRQIWGVSAVRTVGATSAMKWAIGLGRPKSVSWTTKPSTPDAASAASASATSFDGPGDESAPAAEPALAPTATVSSRVGAVAREPDGVLHRDPRVARERAQLVEPVDRVGRAVPPVGVVAHHRHRELGAGAADVQWRAGQLAGPGAADRAAQLVGGAVVVERLAREHQVEDLDRLAHARRAPAAGRRRCRTSRARARPSPSRARARAGPRRARRRSPPSWRGPPGAGTGRT